MFVCHDQRNGTGCGAVNQDNAQFCKQCGRPLRFAVQVHNPDEVIGDYRIVRVIGHGGFGAVYEAQETASSARTVALKETFDPDQIQSYQAEFAVLARVQHPHLPRYDNVFTAGGNGYLVMELVPGQSLEEVLKKQGGPLLEAQVLGYALQLCDALGYLHRQTPTILHRDIKPANVRLTPEGLIKLVDFGLVKEGGGTTHHSRRAVTPPYAPPEQWGIGGQHTDPRSDLYALGATLYHLLTGLEPPPATDRISVTPDPLLTPQSVNPTLSPAVADAIVQSMALAVNQRPADAAALRRLLVGGGRTRRPPAAQATASPTPPVTPPAPVVTPAPPPAPAPKTRSGSDLPWLISLAIFVALAGVMTIFFTFASLPAAPAPFNTHTPTWTPTAPPADTVIADAPAATPRLPPATLTPGPRPTSTPLSVATATPLPVLAELTIKELVNIRSGPGTDNDVLGQGKPGERFLIVGKDVSGDWWEIDLKPGTGWVAAQFVTAHNTDDVPGVMVLSLEDDLVSVMREVNGVLYVYVPAGEFLMGRSDGVGESDEHPQHTVYLDAFWIMQTEVTNAQYAKCVVADACSAPNNSRWLEGAYAEHPVTNVDWYQANDYAAWVGGRLPTEAEWEKAARRTDARIYPWGNESPDRSRANCCEFVNSTTPVGSYPADISPYGALDMAGNVMEWTADWYDSGYYSQSPAQYPTGPASGEWRVLRGGSFLFNVHVVDRVANVPDYRVSDLGFRVAVLTPGS